MEEKRKVQYRLRRSARRRTIAIQVNAQGDVVVSAPQWVSAGEIQRIVDQKQRWISKQLERLEREAYPAVTRRYHEGETWYFFGRPLVLRYIEGTAYTAKDDTTGQLLINCKTSRVERRAALCRNVYREAGRKYIGRRLVYLCRLLDEASGGSLRPREVRLRSMSRRWGGCSRDGVVTLSLRLFCLPEYLVDYIVLHELAHLYVFHHGSEFYQLLERMVPQWREYRRSLKRWSGLAIV